MDRSEKVTLVKLLLSEPMLGCYLRMAKVIELTATQTELVIIMPERTLQRDLAFRAIIYKFLLAHGYDLAVTIA